MRLVLSPFVKPDLEEIADWIARDNPRRAVRFIQEIRARFRKIGRDPQLYQLRPEIGEDARLAVIGRYVILFRMSETVVRIERVVHGGRDLPAVYASPESE